MINLEAKTITIQDQVYEITRFEVWWVTPFGITENLDEAIKRIKESDFPILALRPIPVAVTGSLGIYEPLGPL